MQIKGVWSTLNSFVSWWSSHLINTYVGFVQSSFFLYGMLNIKLLQVIHVFYWIIACSHHSWFYLLVCILVKFYDLFKYIYIVIMYMYDLTFDLNYLFVGLLSNLTLNFQFLSWDSAILEDRSNGYIYTISKFKWFYSNCKSLVKWVFHISGDRYLGVPIVWVTFILYGSCPSIYW